MTFMMNTGFSGDEMSVSGSSTININQEYKFASMMAMRLECLCCFPSNMSFVLVFRRFQFVRVFLCHELGLLL